MPTKARVWDAFDEADRMAKDMSIPEPQRLKAANDAKEFAAMLRTMGGDEPSTNTFFQPAEAVVDTAVAEAPGFAKDSLETFSDFGRGIHAGVNNITRDAMKLGLQVTGSTDHLAYFNETTRQAKEKQAEEAKRSPIAYGAGDIIGEGLALSPIGGFSGLATKGVFKRLAAEGFAEGFLTSNSDNISGRTVDGAIGSGVSMAGGKLMDTVTDWGGSAIRAWRNKGDAADAVTDRIAREVSPRIKAASDYGGFELSGNTAAATAASLQEMNDIIGKGDVVSHKMVAGIARQEEAITNRAWEFVDQFGADRIPLDESGELVANALDSVRKADRDTFEASYKQLDKIAKTQNFILPNRDRLASQIETMDFSDNAAGVATDIKNIFNRYGIGADVNTPEDSVKFLTKRLTEKRPQKELTFGTYNELRKELNGFYGKPLNGSEKKAIFNAKQILDDHINSAMDDPKIGGTLSVRLARKATEEFKDFHASWDDKAIITRIANSVDGNYGDMDFSKVVTKLTSRSNTTGLQQVKAKLLTQGKAGEATWNSLQQAPILDAMEKAIADTSRNVAENGVIPFNHKAFERALNKNVSKKAQAELWTGAKYDAGFMDEAIASWKTRDRVALSAYRQNPSGTAMKIMQQLRFLPQGMGRNIGMAASGVSDTIADTTFRRAARDTAADKMLAGELSENAMSDMTLEALAVFEEEYRGGAARRYAEMLTDMVRRGIIFDSDSSYVNEDEETP